MENMKNEIIRARSGGKENTASRILAGTDSLSKFGGVINTLENMESETSDDIEYLIYILIGVDIILLTIIIAFLWKKRYVVATGDWQELLEV